MTENANITPFEKRCEILADLWVRDDEKFKDFIIYNNLGLPLAYAVANGIIETNPKVKKYCNEAWDMLISSLDRYSTFTTDTGFESLDDLLGSEQ